MVSRPTREGTLLAWAGASLGTLLGVLLGVGGAVLYTTHSDDDMAMWIVYLTAPLGASLGALAGAVVGVRWGERRPMSLLGKCMASAVTAVCLLVLIGGFVAFLLWSGWVHV